ncbi:hypothetical protein E2320_014013 [Naja naja]|nr:hypothetical protein E2320_014013 [Naja naja]
MAANRSVWDECYAQCPASTVTIQPPPFVLTIPGPALYCPDQPLGIEQHNPCAAVPIPMPRVVPTSPASIPELCQVLTSAPALIGCHSSFADPTLNSNMPAGSNMSDHCTFSCPPLKVTIQPPPFIITLPGPSICCPDQPLHIEQHNPCAINHNSPPQAIRASSFYSRALPSTPYSPRIYQF